MFFAWFILNPQHKGRFMIPWLAATRGIRYVSKKDIIEIDIVQICDDIMKYVASESASPRARFSLRLSSILINGTVKLYQKKVTLFIDELVIYTTSISRPISVDWPVRRVPAVKYRKDDVLSDFTPVPRKRGTKRPLPDEKSTPEVQLDQFMDIVRSTETAPVEIPAITAEDLAILESRASDITLREEKYLAEPVPDFGPLGTLEPVEEQLVFGAPHPARELFPPLPEEQVEDVSLPRVAAGVSPVKPRRRLSSSSSEAGIASVKLTVQPEVHVPASSVEPVSVSPRTVPVPVSVDARPPQLRRSRRSKPSPEYPPLDIRLEKTQEVEPEGRERTVLGELQRDVVEDRDEQLRVAKPRKEKPRILKRTKHIIRKVDTERSQQKDIIRYYLTSDIKKKSHATTYMINEYVLMRAPVPEEMRGAIVDETPQDSLLLGGIEVIVTPPAEILHEPLPRPPITERLAEEQIVEEAAVVASQPLLTSTPITSREEQRNIEEVMAAEGIIVSPRKRLLRTPISSPIGRRDAGEMVTEELMVSPTKKRRVISEEPFITLPSEFMSRDLTALAPSIQQETVESVSVPVVTAHARQQDIVNKVFASGSLTIEEVSQRPLTKLNVARAVMDVLVLSRYGYVNFTTEGNLSELKSIVRGPKMNL